MTRLVFALLLCCAALSAQNLTFAIHDPSGSTPDVPLPANYSFTATPQGSSTSIEIKVTNPSSSGTTIALYLVYIGNAANSSAADADFSITGLTEDKTLAPGGAMYFDLNFTPGTTGSLSGYLQAAYAVQQNGCSLLSLTTATECPTTYASISTLTGSGTPPQLVLSFSNQGTETPLQPNQPRRLDFGNVSVSATASITFTLTNETSAPISTPAIQLQNEVFNSSAFALNASSVPPAIPANGSANFEITFAPGQAGYTTTTLAVGTNTYGLQGTGVVISDIDALEISYIDATGVRISPQAATPIDFGQIVPGAGSSAALKFTVTNPATSFNPVTLPSLSVTGAGFALAGALTLPASIQPGASVTFSITFSALNSGTSTGTLALGTRTFSLTGLAVVSPVPALSFQLSQQVLTSQQQVTIQVQFASAATQDAIGELSMAFAPSVTGVNDDPAILFLATSGRQLQVKVASGAQSATYNGASALTFQTGTTAGTLTFTATFPNTPPYKQSFTIAPAQMYISSATAIRQSPNLVVTINGYDNTYSAGKMNFTFYDLIGNPLNKGGMAVDATTDFHQYFFTNNTAGGAFAVQAKFPVTGDATQIGSVSLALDNSAGDTTSKLDFH